MQSPEEASKLMAGFVENSVARAEKAQAEWEQNGNDGISDAALEELIDALHAVQDGTSPDHVGFQPWGIGFGVRHGIHETIAAHTDVGAWQAGINVSRALFLRVFGERQFKAATKEKEVVDSTINYNY